ncbi:ent-kaurenoic acid oxidase 1-like [Rutidosis leptorrhynchoides]|uniref:ent-kaurenoic acid oxidase 1-like n=1 Tax=Rutidosis leptorrhynchoides TaxID=125765 RepID=UPI003A9970C4
MVVLLWFTAVFGAVPLVACLLWWWNDIWYGLVMATRRLTKGGTKLPPGHMGLPIFGETFTFFWYFKFLRRPEDYINFKRHKYGDGIGMYKTHLFGKPSVIMCTPAATKYVFRADESFKLEFPNVEILGNNSILSVHGKAHMRMKSFISRSANQPDALRRIAQAIQPRIISALESWAQRGNINSYNQVKKVTLENIGMYFASIESGATLDRIAGYYATLVKGLRSYPLNVPGTTYYGALQCRKMIIAIFKEELKKRKMETNRPINDVLDELMNLKDEDGSRLTDIEVLDTIIGILLASFETTSLTTTWAIYYLAKYPKVLQKLRDENMTLKNEKQGQLVTSEEILKLKYTTKVVDETIRMANVAGYVFRRATKDVTYEGYTIPKGWNVILWLRYLHTDATNFDDPMCFNPDRWDAPMAPRTLQVFGGGSRFCAGNMLARLQIALFLHYLSTGYKWKLVNPDAKINYLPHPKPEDGVKITIEKL